MLDRDASIEVFAASQYDRFAPRLDGVNRSGYVETFVRLDARGAVWKDSVYQRLTEELHISAVSWRELFADFEERITNYYRPFPNLHPTLTELATSYRLGLITNGRTEFQSQTIESLGIAEFFDVILISETEGVRKPEPEIFHRALRRLGISPHEAIYVGDHPLTDIRGARNAGMWTIWKRNADFTEAECDGVIEDLAELPALLHDLA